ncbi:hypothetical protein I0Q12_12640 [Rhodococcus sp. CX]|uniref:hypothetical protein n=1 Tax=Rhodococcus sp. CX TaxID=2789880 RepID=UPI0018CCC489|nr:hypothetical protein [Rhodococcus sp. CX]MBH0120315.1 hypothetical protein [Rhodococcus sp. CX]
MSRGQALFAEDQLFTSVGWGLWLVCIGSAALLLGLVLCIVTQLRNSGSAAAAELRALVRDPRKRADVIGSLLCCVVTVVLLVWAFSIRLPWQ